MKLLGNNFRNTLIVLCQQRRKQKINIPEDEFISFSSDALVKVEEHIAAMRNYSCNCNDRHRSPLKLKYLFVLFSQSVLKCERTRAACIFQLRWRRGRVTSSNDLGENARTIVRWKLRSGLPIASYSRTRMMTAIIVQARIAVSRVELAEKFWWMTRLGA